eukprot:3390511-Pyramimonas_sp.AAC.1
MDPPVDLQDMWGRGKTAVQLAANTFPHRRKDISKPWITQTALDLMHRRSEARATNGKEEEKRWLKEVRKSCKQDKTIWSDKEISSGNWDALKRHCRPKPRRQGRLRSTGGDLVDNTQRAGTMAEHLEKARWKIRPAELLDDDPIAEPLPVLEADFTTDEVGKTMRKLKRGKASGVDDTPA